MDSELPQPDGQRGKPEDEQQQDPGLGIPAPPPADTATWSPPPGSSGGPPAYQPPGHDRPVSPSDDTDPNLSALPAERPGAAPPTVLAYPGTPPQSPGAPPYPGAPPPPGAYPGAPPGAAPPYPGAPPPGAYPGALPPPGAYPSAAPPYPYPGQVQQGYPGARGSYPNAPGYYPPAPPRKSRHGLIIGIVVGAVVVVAGAVTGAALLLLGRAVSPTTMALKSGQAVASATGLTLTGTIAGESASMTVTRAGTVEGSYSHGGNQITRITIQGATYLKAPTAFWASTSVGQTSATQAGGNWAKAPPDAVKMSFDTLTPAQVSRVLEHVGKNPRFVRTTLDGTNVIKLSARGATYYISTTSPFRLLTALDAATIGPVFTLLHADMQGLQGAVDPEAIVLPLVKIRFGPDCSAASSCTVSSKVTVAAAAGSATVLVKMTVDFSGTKNGTPFATCTQTTVATSLASVSQSCGVGGSVWSGWFNSHTGNFTTWADAHFETMVNSASNIAALQTELSHEQQVG